jgi:tRNA nucleotidyltransferase (CCA-adding enzyme)
MTEHGLVDKLQESLPPAAESALARTRQLAEEAGVSLFLVGGALRDLLLGSKAIDLDLAVEGDPAPIARQLAEETGGRAVLHERFGTATVEGPAYSLDLARTRRETYDHPGALPTVEPAGLDQDLARRDFSINAMALRLTAPAGELIDPFGGERDLRQGLVRVLHDRSYRDDATRMLRAARYGARLRFRLEEETEAALRRDLESLDPVSGPRLRRELSLMFLEAAAPEAVRLCSELGVLSAVQPRLNLPPERAQRWRDALASERFGDLVKLGFCLTCECESEEDVGEVSARLNLTGPIEEAMLEFVRLRPGFAKLATRGAGAAEVVEALDGKSLESVWAIAISDAGPAADLCRAYLSDWRHVRPVLSGAELAALGVPAGRRIGEALRKLRTARLQGRVQSREDEIALVRRELL